MALYFNNASTNKLTTGFTTHATQRSFSAWVYRIGTGGGATGRIFDKRTASAQVEVLFFNAGIEFDRNFSGGQGSWKVADSVGTNAWQHILLTYDSGLATNDPLFYVNGSLKTLTLDSNATGTANTNTDAYVIGNRGNDNIRNFDGYISEFAIWDRILTSSEALILAAGYSPSFLPKNLVSYYPLVRDPIDKQGAVGTISGATAVVHPRIIYPASRNSIPFATAAAGGASHNSMFGDGCLVY